MTLEVTTLTLGFMLSSSVMLIGADFAIIFPPDRIRAISFRPAIKLSEFATAILWLLPAVRPVLFATSKFPSASQVYVSPVKLCSNKILPSGTSPATFTDTDVSLDNALSALNDTETLEAGLIITLLSTAACS